MATMAKTYYDVGRLMLWGVRPKDAEKSPRLTYGFRDGYPRFTLHTGIDGERSIPFATDSSIMKIVMRRIKEAARAQPGFKRGIDGIGNKFVNNERTKDLELTARLTIGKDDNGLVYMIFSVNNGGNYLFRWQMNQYHKLRDGEGQEEPPEVASKELALSWAELGDAIIEKGLWKYTEDEYDRGEWKPYEIQAPGTPRTGKTTFTADKAAPKAAVESIDLGEFDPDVPF